MRAGLRGWFVLVAVALGGAGARAQNCVPPAEMKARIAGAPSVEEMNAVGVWFAQQQRFDCAVEAFATSLQTDGKQRDLAHVVFEFGAALFYSGDPATSVTAFRQAESLGYREVTLHVLLATALDEQGATAEAIEEWRRALEFDPDAARELDALSHDLVAAGRYQDAVELLERPRVGPYRTVAQFLDLAGALIQLGRADEAAMALEEGLNTYPDSGEMARQLVTVLVGLKRDGEAGMVIRLGEKRGAGT